MSSQAPSSSSMTGGYKLQGQYRPVVQARQSNGQARQSNGPEGYAVSVRKTVQQFGSKDDPLVRKDSQESQEPQESQESQDLDSGSDSGTEVMSQYSLPEFDSLARTRSTQSSPTASSVPTWTTPSLLSASSLQVATVNQDGGEREMAALFHPIMMNRGIKVKDFRKLTSSSFDENEKETQITRSTTCIGGNQCLIDPAVHKINSVQPCQLIAYINYGNPINRSELYKFCPWLDVPDSVPLELPFRFKNDKNKLLLKEHRSTLVCCDFERAYREVSYAYFRGDEEIRTPCQCLFHTKCLLNHMHSNMCVYKEKYGKTDFGSSFPNRCPKCNFPIGFYSDQYSPILFLPDEGERTVQKGTETVKWNVTPNTSYYRAVLIWNLNRVSEARYSKTEVDMRTKDTQVKTEEYYRRKGYAVKPIEEGLGIGIDLKVSKAVNGAEKSRLFKQYKPVYKVLKKNDGFATVEKKVLHYTNISKKPPPNGWAKEQTAWAAKVAMMLKEKKEGVPPPPLPLGNLYIELKYRNLAQNLLEVLMPWRFEWPVRLHHRDHLLEWYREQAKKVGVKGATTTSTFAEKLSSRFRFNKSGSDQRQKAVAAMNDLEITPFFYGIAALTKFMEQAMDESAKKLKGLVERLPIYPLIEKVEETVADPALDSTRAIANLQQRRQYEYDKCKLECDAFAALQVARAMFPDWHHIAQVEMLSPIPKQDRTELGMGATGVTPSDWPNSNDIPYTPPAYEIRDEVPEDPVPGKTNQVVADNVDNVFTIDAGHNPSLLGTQLNMHDIGATTDLISAKHPDLQYVKPASAETLKDAEAIRRKSNYDRLSPEDVERAKAAAVTKMNFNRFRGLAGGSTNRLPVTDKGASILPVLAVAVMAIASVGGTFV